MIGRPFRLVVNDREGKKIFDRDLVETMMTTGHFNTQEDFDREDEYDIVIRMDGDVAVSVTVNGWQAVEIEPDL